MKTYIETSKITETVDAYKVGNKRGTIEVWMSDPLDESENQTGRKLTPMAYDQFINKINVATEANNENDDCLNYYAVDSSNNIVVAEQTVYRLYEDGDEVRKNINYSVKTFGYKTATAQYYIPVMFFLDINMVVHCTDYVLELAKQVEDTKIIIMLQDNRTETVKVWEETRGDDEDEYTVTMTSVDITNVLNPVVTKADTLLYKKEMIYTNKVTISSSGETTITKNTYNPGLDKDPEIKINKFRDTITNSKYMGQNPLDDMESGGTMMFDFMNKNVQNETLEQTLKYILFRITGHDYGVIELDNSLFDFSDFTSFDLITGGVGYSSINITDEDLEILYKITSAERGDGTQEQQQYVVSVILNRVLCQNRTIKDIVFAPNQFEPISSGSYYKQNPSETTKAAVHYVIQNGDTTGGATYFCTPKASETNSWYRSSIAKGTLMFLFNDAGGIPNSHNFYATQSDLDKLAQHKQSTANGSSQILNKAAELWTIVSTSGKYTKYGGSSVPCKGSTIDCSAFVSWVLYECGYEEFKGGQHSTAVLYSTNWTKTHPDWQEIPVASGENPISILQPGDIFVRYGEGTHHVLIVAYTQGGQLYAYDCGSLSSWANANGKPVDKSYFLTKKGAGKIIRIQSKNQNGTVINPKGQYLVAIDAGHGVSAPSDYYTTGTAATYKGKYYTEWEWNRQVADRVVEILSQNSKISVIRIGNSAENPKLKNTDRIPMAKSANANLYVSIHFNSNNNSSASGTEVYATKGDNLSTEFRKSFGKFNIIIIRNSK